VDEASWRAAWELKVFGYVNLCRAVYGRMRRAGGGVIVNVIGTGGERHDPAYVAGVTANAGLMAFTRALGAAGPDAGVRVVGVNPGITRTDRMEQQARRRAEAAGADPGRWRELLPELPMGRPAEPAEVADVVVFLASPRAGYVSGTVVTVDAGRSVR
jgi:NAD(P)-dependent dehydrogenase (short-subunit alcohol dehydrogenase family)